MVDVLGQTIAPLMRTNADVASFYGRPREKMLECGDIELDALECLEAYGSRRGRVLCDKYIQDFRECMKQYIQVSPFFYQSSSYSEFFFFFAETKS